MKAARVLMALGGGGLLCNGAGLIVLIALGHPLRVVVPQIVLMVIAAVAAVVGAILYGK